MDYSQITSTKDKSDETASFHRFSEFPIDIRDLIWDAAIQNHYAEPEAHFLDMGLFPYKYKENARPGLCKDSWSSWRSALDVAPASRSIVDDEEFLGRFYGEEALNKHKMRSTSSGYQLDSCLWSACKESRRAVLRRWNVVHRQMKGGDTGSINVSVVQFQDATFPSYLGAPIVMRPDDLIICHFPDLYYSKGHELSNALAPWGPESKMRTRHVAIDFDQSWTKIVSILNCAAGWRRCFQMSKIVARLCEQAHSLKTNHGVALCLVEDRIVPAEGVKYQRLVKDCDVFIAKGRRYIMPHTDSSLMSYHVSGRRPFDSISYASHFCTILNDMLNEMDQTRARIEGLPLPEDQLFFRTVICLCDDKLLPGDDTRP